MWNVCTMSCNVMCNVMCMHVWSKLTRHTVTGILYSNYIPLYSFMIISVCAFETLATVISTGLIGTISI